MSKGVATSFLPLYHYVFIDYSRHIGEKIAEINIELLGKSDLRFIEAMYKVSYDDEHTCIICLSSIFHFKIVQVVSWNKMCNMACVAKRLLNRIHTGG